jgi:hypothetical protein
MDQIHIAKGRDISSPRPVPTSLAEVGYIIEQIKFRGRNLVASPPAAIIGLGFAPQERIRQRQRTGIVQGDHIVLAWGMQNRYLLLLGVGG